MRTEILLYTPDGICTRVHHDGEGAVLVTRKGLTQTAQEWDDSPMLPDNTIAEVDAIMDAAKFMGYKPT